MSATSGLTSPTPFASYDPDSRSLRTWQGTFPWDSTSSSLTLPPSGSMRNGLLYARPTSALATSGRVSSSLLPTPLVGYTGTSLEAYLDRKVASGGGRTVNDLGLAVRMLPTPTVGDSKSAANRTAGRSCAESGHHDGVTLTDAVRLLPTPTTSDAKGPSPNHGGTTAEAIGAITRPPSPDMNEPLGALLLFPPTSEDG